MEILGVEQIQTWMHRTNDLIQENKQQLTELDQAVGDGDHGINMARGFKEVIAKLDANDYAEAEGIMKDTAMTIMSKVGGASGPLYGTAFLKLSKAFKEKDVDYQVFVNGIHDALDGIKQRGKADIGEKTLVDVWSSVADALKKYDQFDGNVLQDEAKTAMERTKGMQATKGRAAYLQERSIGHVDPGSVSSYYLFAALATVIREGV